MWTFIIRYVPWLAKIAGWVGGNKVKLISGVVVAALSIASAAGTGWYIKRLKGEIQELKLTNATVVQYLDECQSANVENMNQLKIVRGANEDLANALKVAENDRVTAVLESTRRAKESERELNELTAELESLRNEEPTCAQIANIDIAAACPAAVDRLRMQAGN